MALIKTAEQIEVMRQGGKILAAILNQLVAEAKPGLKTKQLSVLASELIKENQVKPSFLGYRGYPDVICLSVNHQCVHTPGSDYILQEGDLLKLDFGVIYQGLHTDSARTVLVSNLDKEAIRDKPEYSERRKLIQITRECLEKAIAACRPDGYLGDIGQAVQSHAEHNGYSVAHELGGHGIGQALHEEPWIANTGKSHTGIPLQVGMVLAVEPIINAGSGEIKDGADGHTYETADGALSAHFEHTLVITAHGPEILTS